MCLFSTPEQKAPEMPAEYAAMKAPTRQDAAGAGNKLRDRLRAMTGTLLTGAGGVGAADQSGKKTLLGA